jgi:hypothetical protein
MSDPILLPHAPFERLAVLWARVPLPDSKADTRTPTG